MSQQQVSRQTKRERTNLKNVEITRLWCYARGHGKKADGLKTGSAKRGKSNPWTRATSRCPPTAETNNEMKEGKARLYTATNTQSTDRGDNSHAQNKNWWKWTQKRVPPTPAWTSPATAVHLESTMFAPISPISSPLERRFLRCSSDSSLRLNHIVTKNWVGSSYSRLCEVSVLPFILLRILSLKKMYSLRHRISTSGSRTHFRSNTPFTFFLAVSWLA